MEYQKLLEKYIRNELNEEERDQVEELLLHDKEARQYLQKLEQTFSLVRKQSEKSESKSKSGSDSDTGKPQKSKKKDSDPPESGSSQSVYKLAASLLIIGIFGVAGFLIFDNQNANLAEMDSEEVQELYAGNFEPNPYLEDIIGDVQRSTGRTFELHQPDDDIMLTAEQEEQEYSINFEGEAANLNGDEVYLRLYSNRESDYLEDHSIYQSSLDINNSIISKQVELTLKPGLYYYTFEDSQTYDTLAAGRIIVN